VIDYEKTYKDLKIDIREKNKNSYLNKIKEDKDNPFFIQPLTQRNNYEKSNIELDRTLLKDVHVFDALMGTDKLERQLNKTGIILNDELSTFLRNKAILDESEAMELADLPEFHFTLQDKYDKNFWDYGKKEVNFQQSREEVINTKFMTTILNLKKTHLLILIKIFSEISKKVSKKKILKIACKTINEILTMKSMIYMNHYYLNF
jgi:hypothetical protein